MPGGSIEFAVLHRADSDMWQFVSGGAEDNETPEQAARREAFEEAGIPFSLPLLRLDSRSSVPRRAFPQAVHWPKSVYVLPEHAFAVNVGGHEIMLSAEHREIRWLGFAEATNLLTWESNRTALWELNERLLSENKHSAEYAEYEPHSIRHACNLPIPLNLETHKQIEAVSHITFIVQDVERMARFLCEGLGAQEIYDSKKKNYSLSREKFFVLGGTWLVAMEGIPPVECSYRHVAFKVSIGDLPAFENGLRALGVEVKPPRSRVEGEGESLYFYDFDNHLFELHTGTLGERLQRYAKGV